MNQFAQKSGIGQPSYLVSAQGAFCCLKSIKTKLDFDFRGTRTKPRGGGVGIEGLEFPR